MTTAALFGKIKEQVEFWFELAEEIYSQSFKRPSVNFRLRGHTAGKAFYRTWELRYNQQLLEENYQSFCDRTVPHEVAHLVAFELTEGRCKPHGHWWKSVMRAFGCDVSRCHSYDTTAATVRTVPAEYPYKCLCRTYMFTHIRHRRSIKHGGKYYRCKKCGSYLVYDE